MFSQIRPYNTSETLIVEELPFLSYPQIRARHQSAPCGKSCWNLKHRVKKTEYPTRYEEYLYFYGLHLAGRLDMVISV